jgi:phosphoglycolate phosphatase
MGLRKLIYGLFPELEQCHWPDLEKEFLAIYEQNIMKTAKVYDGVTRFLDSWQNDLAIVSNKNELLLRETISNSSLRKYNWLRLYGFDSLPARKPDPLPLIEAMKVAKVLPHETVMIGDGLPDVLSAKTAGTHSVAVGFGYTPVAELLSAGAEASIYHYDELARVLDSLE